MNNIHNLSIVIVTYKTDENILTNCLNSIDPKVKILVVENSKNNAFKDKFENKYSNLNVILSGINLGYGTGNNLGLSRVKTKYALILNPDIILEKILIIDDLIATGGTANAALQLVELCGGKVSGFIFVINLFDLGGQDKLKKKSYFTQSLINFPGH